MRKAQASMEFLYAYGWAFMIVLISLGVLGYMVFSDSFVADTCYISDSLSCSDYAINNGELLLKVQNGVGSQIGIISIECTSEENVVIVDYVEETGSAINVTSGSFAQISCPGLVLDENRKEKVTFVVEYLENGKSFSSFVNGYVVTTNMLS